MAPPCPPNPPLPSGRPANPLFSLPRIPYFFTITPFPLTAVTTATLTLPCQSGLHSLSPPSRMKRRYTFGSNQRNADTASQGYEVSTGTQFLEPSGQQVQHGQGEDQSSEEPSEHWTDNIEGRVLKKMRRIKLKSESPPPEGPNSTLANLNNPNTSSQPIVQSQRHNPFHPDQITRNQPQHADLHKPFGPIRISTRSPAASESSETVTDSESQESLRSKQILADRSEPAIYSGMNNILFQMHVTRFGNPDISSTLMAPTISSESQYLYEQQYRQQQYQQQQQQQQQSHSQNMVFTANTMWHQAQRNLPVSAQAMDEDDEMSDVNDATEAGNTPPTFRTPGSQDTLGGHALDNQCQQQLLQQESINNVYQDINAELRAAFLTRIQMDKRYQ
ncbi:hypothetical protein BGX21_007235 [Mortierella sp. AD011]|nr:hypothetical protein BGX20_001348 [Mortierella sp. AD010]KAF9403077.1 hypothetical protein BGX21_007235 [Mortierella sp. AD011]